MQTSGRSEAIRIHLTREQKAQVKRTTGRDGEEIELTVEELEERITAKLAANHSGCEPPPPSGEEAPGGSGTGR
jgi:hypothetical protein